MKKILLAVFFSLFIFATSAQAQWSYGLSDVGPDYANSVVFGLTYLEQDYHSFLYNDTYVEGYFFENGVGVDSAATFGSNIAAVITGGAGHNGSVYSQLSKHWLVSVFFQPGVGWLDFWGFSTWGGNFGYSFTWTDRPTVYTAIEFLYLGATIAERVFDATRVADVTLSRVTPAGPVTLAEGMSQTFVADVQAVGGNASGNVGVVATLESNPTGVSFAADALPKTVTGDLVNGRVAISIPIRPTSGRGPVIYRFAITSAPAGVGVAGTPINVSVCYGAVNNGLCQ
jgi:hypothetical protein